MLTRQLPPAILARHRMPADNEYLTGIERAFGDDEIIVSKTDAKGRITYANRVFQTVAGYTEEELLGRAHNIVRHPHMPRCVFKYLWNTIASGNEVFAYVINRAKNGDHYWVFAHVTPSFDHHGKIVGYHSNRRSPSRCAIDKVRCLYDTLLATERKHATPHDQWTASLPVFTKFLESQSTTYEEFVFTLA